MSLRSKTIAASALLAVVLLFVAAHAQSPAERSGDERELINCARYRVKREGVPAYSAPDTTAKTIATLPVGEVVCYVGEQQGFAVVDWSKRELLNQQKPGALQSADGESSTEVEKEEEPGLVFIRTVDLWEPREPAHQAQSKGFLERIREYFLYLRSGGVPEDIMGPFRPEAGEPECLAGAICERVREGSGGNGRGE